MKLGTSSPLAHDSPKEWAQNHRDLGLEAVNFPLTCETKPEIVDEYVKAAKECKLEIAEVGVWRNTLDPRENVRKEAIAYTIGQLELADRMEAKCCVNILGARGPRWDGAYKDNFSKDTWDMGVKTIREIIDGAKPKKTFFTIESMPWMVPTGPDEYLRLLEAVDREQFAVHLDVFNWITTPKRYFYNEEFIDECFEKLGEYTKSCHLKNVRMEEDYTLFFRETDPKSGGINLSHLIKKGEFYNKEMPFIVEHLDTDQEYLESIAYIKEVVSRETRTHRQH